MALQVVQGSPLAEALNGAIQTKLMEMGLAQTADAPALSEYIILMLTSGKNQEEIALELCTDLLNLAPGNADATLFVAWMFEHAQQLSTQMGNEAQPSEANDAMAGLEDAVPTEGGDGNGNDTGNGEMEMDTGSGPAELNAPTGPRSMRNGSNPRGGREKRMMGQIGKAMDRSSDPLHRTRGNDRINSHVRGPPTGPRGGGRGGRGTMNARAANVQAGINAMGGLNGRNGPMAGPMAGPVTGPVTGPMTGGWGQQQPQPGEMEIFAMMKQQQEMMAQMQQQLMNGGQGGFGQQRQGKSLFERAQQPHRNNRGNRHHQSNNHHHNNRVESGAGDNAGEIPAAADGEDIDMTKLEPPSPEDTICKYNLRCTNKECKFAHQSPAAPPGTHVDVQDVCSFNAACRNKKCVARHPSPATKLAHQGEQNCKFFPNCHNPQCPFKHPDMPLCRNGAGCTTPDCKFTHVKVKCRFNPCKNPTCAYTHDEGQQGVFKDKVWTAEGGDHVSERRFVVDGADEEIILTQPEGEDNIMGQEGAGAQGLIT